MNREATLPKPNQTFSSALYLKPPQWARSQGGADDDVALVSRARLARNVAGFVFPERADTRTLRLTAQAVRQAARADSERLADLAVVVVDSLSQTERTALVTARRISPELAHGGPHRYALLGEEGSLSVFINEEDHVRVHALTVGNDPLSALASAEDAERRLARKVEWATAPQWGYLTSGLTNFGTGLRLSVLLHLPALRFTGKMAHVLQAARSMDSAVRGVHGEHSQIVGDLYQISNAVTWGRTPVQIAAIVRPLVTHLVEAERAARSDVALRHDKPATEAAQIALARLEQAERLQPSEALTLLSHLRLVAVTGITPSSPLASTILFRALVAELQTAPPLSPSAQVRADIARAAQLRSAMRG
jgi:protein arginine kinase